MQLFSGNITLFSKNGISMGASRFRPALLNARDFRADRIYRALNVMSLSAVF